MPTIEVESHSEWEIELLNSSILRKRKKYIFELSIRQFLRGLDRSLLQVVGPTVRVGQVD